MEMLGKTAEEISHMTLSEICVACIDVEKEVKGDEYNEADLRAYFTWWDALSDEEKLYAEDGL